MLGEVTIDMFTDDMISALRVYDNAVLSRTDLDEKEKSKEMQGSFDHKKSTFINC